MFFFFKQKTAYEMRISDWSSDVCSSDLRLEVSRASGAAAACRAPCSARRLAWPLPERSGLAGRTSSERGSLRRKGGWPGVLSRCQGGSFAHARYPRPRGRARLAPAPQLRGDPGLPQIGREAWSEKVLLFLESS